MSMQPFKKKVEFTVSFFQTKMKQLEQEAHRAAGEIFLITSSAQLRAVRIRADARVRRALPVCHLCARAKAVQ